VLVEGAWIVRCGLLLSLLLRLQLLRSFGSPAGQRTLLLLELSLNSVT
jgi:hypothetical protein